MSINDTLFTLTKELHDLQLQLNNTYAALDSIRGVVDGSVDIRPIDKMARLVSILELERNIREGNKS